MAKVRELCSLIHAVYDSESQFATAIGWTKQRMNRITNGVKEPDLSEVAEIADGLRQPFEKIAYIFLHDSRQMGNTKRAEE